MQTRSDKEKIIREAADRVRESKALVFAKYEGLTVKETQELKRELRKSGNAFQVLKKTLLSIALREAGVSVDARKLDGQVGLAFSSDETSAAKTMVEFSKKHPNLAVLSGSLGEKELSVKDVEALSKLPTLDEMRAKLVGTMQAPVAGFVRTISGNLSGLVRTLQAISEQKNA